MADFDRRDDGTPTPAHTWEEQFLPLRENGYKGPPPAEKLYERVNQLALAAQMWPDHKAAKGWLREAHWRRKQWLSQIEEKSNGDAERQE